MGNEQFTSYEERQKAAQFAFDAIEPAVFDAMRKGFVHPEARHAFPMEFLDPLSDDGCTLATKVFRLDPLDNSDVSRFQDIAHRKCRLAYRTGMDTAKVKDKCPHLLDNDDPPYGGAVNRDGIVVGGSAFKAWWDTMFSAMAAEAYKAYWQDKFNTTEFLHDRVGR